MTLTQVPRLSEGEGGAPTDTAGVVVGCASWETIEPPRMGARAELPSYPGGDIPLDA